ncbi:helix-turn-helix transcriptional regulator [Staphylococcus succinus]|uniref:helix-turn-helix domain-containing protein n=1 Tax=Staphylococcus succinus TaxID=61015 RepID=UPI002481253C|nr:helix-turn-helix transcriptional regulator [Staphylococcus succinus]MDH9161269.1 helix-turn-helix transcriptional regulator [Staphylococcus succinus]
MMLAKPIKPIDRKFIGYRIASLRAGEGWSQEKFGEAYAAGKTVVSKWENGINIPSMERLKEIANNFNVTVEWLLYGEGENDGNI